MSKLNQLMSDYLMINNTATEQYRSILGISVSVLTAPAAIEKLDQRIQLRLPTKIAFLNANLANKIAEDRQLKILISSFLVLNDGVGVDLASLVLYKKKFPTNLLGTDFVPHYLTQTRHELRIGLLGGTDAVIGKTVDTIGRMWPRHKVVFSHHGYFDVTEESTIAQAIAHADCQIVLVAMGNPQQEQWISRNIPDACPMGFAVGALFNYMTSTVHRAPSLVVRWRFEWLYRLLTEPRRLWRRYLLGNPVFIARVVAQWSKRGSSNTL